MQTQGGNNDDLLELEIQIKLLFDNIVIKRNRQGNVREIRQELRQVEKDLRCLSQ